MTNKEKLNEAVRKAKEKNRNELAFMKADIAKKLKSMMPYLNEIADLVQYINYRIEYYDINMTLIMQDNAIVFKDKNGDGFRCIPHNSFWFCEQERKNILSLRKQYGIACEAERILKERHASIIEYIIQSVVKKEMKKDIDVDSYYKING